MPPLARRSILEQSELKIAAQPKIALLAYLIEPLSLKSGASVSASRPSATPRVLAAAMCVSARGMSPPLAWEAPLALLMSEACSNDPARNQAPCELRGGIAPLRVSRSASSAPQCQ